MTMSRFIQQRYMVYQRDDSWSWIDLHFGHAMGQAVSHAGQRA